MTWHPSTPRSSSTPCWRQYLEHSVFPVRQTHGREFSNPPLLPRSLSARKVSDGSTWAYGKIPPTALHPPKTEGQESPPFVRLRGCDFIDTQRNRSRHSGGSRNPVKLFHRLVEHVDAFILLGSGFRRSDEKKFSKSQALRRRDLGGFRYTLLHVQRDGRKIPTTCSFCPIYHPVAVQ